MITTEPVAPSRLPRFNMAVQRSRAVAVLLTIPFFWIAGATGSIREPWLPYLALVGASALSGIVLHELYRRGVERLSGIPLHAIWMPADILALTAAIHLTGGMSSLWFITYLSNSAVAAFLFGKRAAWLVSIGNIAAYMALLLLRGEIALFDAGMLEAAFRMGILYGVGFFPLSGIANLQEKRLTIMNLKEAESRKVAELTRLAEELDAKTRELADANRRIMEADRAKSQFLANMSHELRTPMNSIIGFSEILKERLEAEIAPRYIEFLDHINTSGQHLLGIVNDVLDLSKIESGKMELFPERFAPWQVAEGVCHVMRGQASKQGITIRNEIPPTLPQIECDLAKFKQILYNLLSNSVKFSPAGSTVLLDGRADAGNVTISVIDNGIGIAPENHDLIFQEFRQVDGSPRRAHGGTGLGLALVRKFVELHKGSITVESNLGSGSSFHVTLPIIFQATRVDEAGMVDLQRLPEGDRVLVIEDDPAAFESVRALLESSGYAVVRARNGEEALRLARSIKPVAITLDIVLPDMDGWEVLKRLKNDRDSCGIPVVIISMVDGRELGLALGAHDYFVKPIDRGRLVERLAQILRPSGSRKPRLLVIDDDLTFHALIDGELTGLGYELHQATSGAEGLRMAASTNPDLIILDLSMPGMSGFEVATLLKEQVETARIPILVMTAKELTVDDRRELQSKISGLLPKGESKTRLLSAIRQLELQTM
jgi:signal transduction histidine kinase/CheY-like chemotaxis protein